MTTARRPAPTSPPCCSAAPPSSAPASPSSSSSAPSSSSSPNGPGRWIPGSAHPSAFATSSADTPLASVRGTPAIRPSATNFTPCQLIYRTHFTPRSELVNTCAQRTRYPAAGEPAGPDVVLAGWRPSLLQPVVARGAVQDSEPHHRFVIKSCPPTSPTAQQGRAGPVGGDHPRVGIHDQPRERLVCGQQPVHDAPKRLQLRRLDVGLG
jgi:hypothetical protein